MKQYNSILKAIGRDLEKHGTVTTRTKNRMRGGNARKKTRYAYFWVALRKKSFFFSPVVSFKWFSKKTSVFVKCFFFFRFYTLKSEI